MKEHPRSSNKSFNPKRTNKKFLVLKTRKVSSLLVTGKKSEMSPYPCSNLQSYFIGLLLQHTTVRHVQHNLKPKSTIIEKNTDTNKMQTKKASTLISDLALALTTVSAACTHLSLLLRFFFPHHSLIFISVSADEIHTTRSKSLAELTVELPFGSMWHFKSCKW